MATGTAIMLVVMCVLPFLCSAVQAEPETITARPELWFRALWRRIEHGGRAPWLQLLRFAAMKHKAREFIDKTV